MHANPDGSMHTVRTAVPEPTTISFLAVGISLISNFGVPSKDHNQMTDKTMEQTKPLTITIDQIKQIYDYTKYHIGFYFVLLTASGGFATFKGDIAPHQRSLLLVITFVLLIAGIAGALVASRIVYGPWGVNEFLIDKSLFWQKRWKWNKKRNWWWSIADLCLIVEHYGFWLALAIAIIGFVFVGPSAPTPCLQK